MFYVIKTWPTVRLERLPSNSVLWRILLDSYFARIISSSLPESVQIIECSQFCRKVFRTRVYYAHNLSLILDSLCPPPSLPSFIQCFLIAPHGSLFLYLSPRYSSPSSLLVVNFLSSISIMNFFLSKHTLFLSSPIAELQALSFVIFVEI